MQHTHPLCPVDQALIDRLRKSSQGRDRLVFLAERILYQLDCKGTDGKPVMLYLADEAEHTQLREAYNDAMQVPPHKTA